jgi:PIN domain nuclease of toxin-antitoxin system
MKLLFDTHLLIWATYSENNELLPVGAAALIDDPRSELLFSSASIWEMAIKQGVRRGGFDWEPRLVRRGLLDHGWSELPITSDHALAVTSLPSLHKDPFDRILLGQAVAEGVALVTVDEMLIRYGSPVRRV